MNKVKIKADARILVFLSMFFCLLVSGAAVSYPSNNESGGSGSMPPGMIKGSSTDPKTGIRTDAVRHPDGTTTITKFDSSGKMISQQTKGGPAPKPQAPKSRGFFGRPPAASPPAPPPDLRVVGQGNSTNPVTGEATAWTRFSDGTTQVTRLDRDGNLTQEHREPPPKPEGASPAPKAADTPLESPKDKASGPPSPGEAVNQWIKDTFGEGTIKVPEEKGRKPTQDAGNSFREPDPQNVDIVEVTKQDSTVSHVAFDAGRGEVVVVMKNGTTMTADTYLKSKKPASEAGNSLGEMDPQTAEFVEMTKQDPEVSHVAFDAGRGEVVVVMKEGMNLSTSEYLQWQKAAKEWKAMEGDTQPHKKTSSGQTRSPSQDKSKEGKKTSSAATPKPRVVDHSDPFVESIRYAQNVQARFEMGERIGEFMAKTSMIPFKNPFKVENLQKQSKRIDQSMDQSDAPKDSSSRLEFDGALGRQFRSGPGSQGNLGDLLQGNNFGGASHGGGASLGSSSCD